MEKIGLKKIFGNSMWQIGEKIITMLLTVIVSSLIARYLGPQDYGLVSYIVSVVSLYTTFSILGMQEIVVKDIVNNEDEDGTIICTGFIIRVIGGIVLILLSQITLLILNGLNITYQILGAIMGSCMIFKSFEVIEYYLQAKMKLKVIAIIRFITTLIVLAAKVLVVVFQLGSMGYMATYLIDAVVAGSLLYIYYKTKNKNQKWKFNINYAKNLLSRSWYIAVSGIFSVIYARIDQIMLKTMLNSTAENGIYAVAVKIAEMWYFVPSAIVVSFQPIINAEKKEHNEKRYIELLQQLYDIVALVGIAFGIMILLFGKIAINILYGAEYAASATVLSICVWSGLFATLGVARSVWMINENLQKYNIVYTLAGAVTNIVLNILIIPKLGAIGAAITTVISEIVADVITLLCFKQTRKSSIMILKAIFYNQTLFKIIKLSWNKLKRVK